MHLQPLARLNMPSASGKGYKIINAEQYWAKLNENITFMVKDTRCQLAKADVRVATGDLKMLNGLFKESF